MNELNMNVITLAIGLAFGTSAMAQGIARHEYTAARDRIAAEYKADKAACASLSGNPNDICMAKAEGKKKVAKAELEVTNNPTRKTRYQANIAKADAEYAVAKEQCDDKAGNAKDICLKEAKAAETSAKADAKLKMKTSDANAAATEKSTEARSEAADEVKDASKDAKTDKLDAQYSVAKEKCDAFAGNAKDDCLAQAKARFGQ